MTWCVEPFDRVSVSPVCLTVSGIQKHGVERNTLAHKLVELEGPTDLVRDSLATVYSGQSDYLNPIHALTKGQVVWKRFVHNLTSRDVVMAHSLYRLTPPCLYGSTFSSCTPRSKPKPMRKLTVSLEIGTQP
jgi:hypothetical protein